MAAFDQRLADARAFALAHRPAVPIPQSELVAAAITPAARQPMERKSSTTTRRWLPLELPSQVACCSSHRPKLVGLQSARTFVLREANPLLEKAGENLDIGSFSRQWRLLNRGLFQFVENA